ncbi:TPA: hypothetical protein N0F65_009033 [Lagenidium giganteum]|uniref:Uncharacterized protein n=1 Tax=Lagenidium giganteum TaxID=4803 RepID=A0AAV2YWI0_9STRA|nr:TPA: hypothetical protein N0F65_009033 [Lagenidium giganteum]
MRCTLCDSGRLALSSMATHGLSSGEVFVRVRGSELFSPNGLLGNAKPFLRDLLVDSHSIEEQVQPWKDKLERVRSMRESRKALRESRRELWLAAKATVRQSHAPDDAAPYVSVKRSTAERAVEQYLNKFHSLERMYEQYLMNGVLNFYAVLEAERKYIQEWMQREETICNDMLRQAKVLYQFNTFATHLENETSGQVSLCRLPKTDAQRVRCVKAATENIKKGFFAPMDGSSGSGGRSGIDVLDVYKIDNRLLLKSFQQFTKQLAITGDSKIKGLFCTVPSESIEHCIVYGMHQDEQSFLRVSDPDGTVLFNRPTSIRNASEAPGTARDFHARRRVADSKPMNFPRRFSRYSTLEETRDHLGDTTIDLHYLALCRVAMGKTVRVKHNTGAVDFPDDARVCTIQFSAEDEYVVRSAEAVVPEFLIQYRYIDSPLQPESAPADIPIIPVDLSRRECGELQSRLLQREVDKVTSIPIGAFPYSTQAHGMSSSSESIRAPLDLVQYCPSQDFLLRHPVSTARRRNRADNLSAEAVLENCAHQRQWLREDFLRLQRLFWIQAREIWGQSGPFESGHRTAQEVGDSTEKSGKPRVAIPSSLRSQSLMQELEVVKKLEVELKSRKRRDSGYNIQQQVET